MQTQPRTRALTLAVLLIFLVTACKANPTQPVSTEASLAGATITVQSSLPPANTQAVGQPTAGTQSAPAGCTVVSRAPTPGPTQQSLFPPVNDADWKKGASTAYLTILEYSDFQ